MFANIKLVDVSFYRSKSKKCTENWRQREAETESVVICVLVINNCLFFITALNK